MMDSDLRRACLWEVCEKKAESEHKRSPAATTPRNIATKDTQTRHNSSHGYDNATGV